MLAGTIDRTDSEFRPRLQSAQAEIGEVLSEMLPWQDTESPEPQDFDSKDLKELLAMDNKSKLGARDVRTLRRLTCKKHGHDMESWAKLRFPKLAQELPWRGPAERCAARLLRAVSKENLLDSILLALVVEVRLAEEFF